MAATEVASFGGMVLGSIILVALLVSYMRKQALAVSGVVLASYGFLLFGLALWASINFKVSPDGAIEFGMELTRPGALRDGAPNLKPSIVTAAKYKIAVVDASDSLNDEDIEPVVKALQTQVTRDLAPAWGVDAELTYVSAQESAPETSWQLILTDKEEIPGALAFHDLSPAGLPIAKVSVKTAEQLSEPWSLSASHELLAMLVDPWVNLTVFVEASQKDEDALLYAYEIASPCQGEEYGYEIDGIVVSNFVFPSWFVPTKKAQSGQFDFRRHIDRPFGLCNGSYALVYSLKTREWTTKTADNN
jgi:hypothetical protein